MWAGLSMIFTVGRFLIVCLNCSLWCLSRQFDYNPSTESCSDSSITQKVLATLLQNGKCKHFKGQLVFQEDDHEVESVVKGLETITGCIHMVDTRITEADFSSLKNLTYSSSCPTAMALLVIGNENLNRIIFHDKFVVDQKRVFVRGNKALRRSQIVPNGTLYDIGAVEECSMKEMLKNKNCTTVVGVVQYTSLVKVIRRVKEVQGQLVVESTSLKSLATLVGISVSGFQSPALVIQNNPDLTDISGLLDMSIDAPSRPFVRLFNNGEHCELIDLRQRISELVKPDQIVFTEKCLKTCGGGFVNRVFLNRLLRRKCAYIDGNIIIEEIDAYQMNLTPLKNIVRMSNGMLVFKGNRGFQNMSFLKHLESISHVNSLRPVVQIHSNRGLKNIGMDALKEINLPTNLDVGVIIRTYEPIDEKEQEQFRRLTADKVLFGVMEDHERPTWKLYDEKHADCYPGLVTQEDFHEIYKNTRCRVVFGEIEIRNTGKILSRIQEIRRIVGCLNIINTTLVTAELSNLTTLQYVRRYCTGYYALRVMENDDLEKLEFHHELEIYSLYGVEPHEITFIGGNKKLTKEGVSPDIRFQYFDPQVWCSQNEARRKKTCKVVVGYVNYLDLINFGSEIEAVSGQLQIVDTNLTTLKDIIRYAVYGHQSPAVVIQDNKKLEYVGDVLNMNITAAIPTISMVNNERICANASERSEIRRKTLNGRLAFVDTCLETCKGGYFNEDLIQRFQHRKCAYVDGSLLINTTQTGLSKLSILQGIEILYGSLVIVGNHEVTNLFFLNYLREIISPKTLDPVIILWNFTDILPPLLANLKKVNVSDNVAIVVRVQTAKPIYRDVKRHLQSLTGNRALFTLHDVEEVKPTTSEEPESSQEMVTEDNTLYGIILTLTCAAVMAVFGYAGAFAVYRWELEQEEPKEKRTSQLNKVVGSAETSR